MRGREREREERQRVTREYEDAIARAREEGSKQVLFADTLCRSEPGEPGEFIYICQVWFICMLRLGEEGSAL